MMPRIPRRTDPADQEENDNYQETPQKRKWSKSMELKEAVRVSRRRPILIKLLDGYRNPSNETLTFSNGDTMALEGTTMLKGSSVVMVHYVDYDIDDGDLNLDDVYRALLTLPEALLPDIDVCILEDQHAYRNFVDSNFRDNNWSNRQLLDDLEQDDSDVNDYMNSITVIDLTTRQHQRRQENPGASRSVPSRPPPLLPPSPGLPPPRMQPKEADVGEATPPPRPPKTTKPVGTPTASQGPPTPFPKPGSSTAAQLPPMTLPKPVAGHQPPARPPGAHMASRQGATGGTDGRTDGPPPESPSLVYNIYSSSHLSAELRDLHIPDFAGSWDSNPSLEEATDPKSPKEKKGSKVRGIGNYIKTKIRAKPPSKASDTQAKRPQQRSPRSRQTAPDNDDSGDNYVEIADDEGDSDADNNYAVIDELRMDQSLPENMPATVPTSTSKAAPKKKKGKKAGKKEEKPIMRVGPMHNEVDPSVSVTFMRPRGQMPAPSPSNMPPPPSSLSMAPRRAGNADDLYEEPIIKGPPPPAQAQGPPSVQNMTCGELSARLLQCGMRELAQIFKDNLIDGAFFLAMPDNALREKPFCCTEFDVTKIKMIKNGWVPNR